MIVVLDATAIIALLDRSTAVDEYVRVARRVMAPDLAVCEVLNVRWKLTRAKLAAPSLEDVLAVFERISLIATISLSQHAADLAERLGHPVYDCLYAAAALREGAQLVTADRRLARKLASSTSIDVRTFSV